VCNSTTPVRKLLGVWPPLPINLSDWKLSILGRDNIVAALKQNSRLHTISLAVPRLGSISKNILAAIKGPFPILTRLKLLSHLTDGTMLVFPNSILGGSAPRLRHLELNGISFPLSELHLCSPNLVDLCLENITSHSGYISPEAMITSLSALTRLERLLLKFVSPPSFPIRANRHPPPTRAVLPSLFRFIYDGTSEYLEDLVARFDAPVLDHICINFFYQLRFDTPQLDLFIRRSPMFQPFNEAQLELLGFEVEIRFLQAVHLGLGIICSELNRQLSSLVQLCGPSFQHLLSKVERLYILPAEILLSDWDAYRSYTEDDRWLKVLFSFIAVKDLYISAIFSGRIMRAIMCRRVLDGERLTEMLPALQNLFLEKSESRELEHYDVRKATEDFVAAKRLSGHNIAVSQWCRK
jgi:hypothetical protein